MSDAHSMQATPPQTPANPPAPNTPEARNPDGSIKSLQDPTSTQPPAKSDTTPESLGAEEHRSADQAKDGKKEGEGDKKAEAKVVPEKYDFKAPEGFELKQEVLDEATPILKELGIDQPGAQRLFDLFSKHATAAQTEMIDLYAEMRNGWRDQIAKGPLGNGKDGLSPETSQNINAALNFLPADLQTKFKDAMNLTGSGDNPAFIEAMSVLGKSFREGTHVAGRQPSPGGQRAPGSAPRSAAQAIFPNLPSANSGS